MRIVLLCGLLVLAACSSAPVKEEPAEFNCMVQPTGSEKWYPCGSQEAKDANCLDLMERATKAVDPYLDSMSLPEATREKTLKMWERMKNECWPEVRDALPQHYH